MKRTNAVLLLCILIAGITTVSCRPTVRLDDPNNYVNLYGPTEWATAFEGFWTGMNTNYVFWDMDPTDWDAVYDSYMPKFKALGIVEESTGETVDTVTGYFTEMLKDIVDGHYTLTSSSLTGSDGYTLYVSPSDERVRNQYPTETAFSQSEIIAENSLIWDSNGDLVVNNDFIAAVQSEIDQEYYGMFLTDVPFYAATGYKTTPDGVILYFYFKEFMWAQFFRDFAAVFPDGTEDALYLAIDDGVENYGGETKVIREILDPTNTPGLTALIGYLETNNASFGLTTEDWKYAIDLRGAMEHFYYFFNQLESRSLADGTPVIGAVIDLRGNIGGAIEDLSTLWGRIVPHDWVFAKQKIKAGENRLDYSPLIDFTVFKAPGTTGDTDIPIALVVNKNSVSCSEVTAMLYQTLPNKYVVGGTTWGAMGNVSSYGPAMVNGGQFSVGDGILESVFTPFCQTLTLDGISLEGKGVTPDYPVPFVYENMMAGQDDRLRKAVEVVKEK
jgi:hypothetical protein